VIDVRSGLIHVPDSAKSYTQTKLTISQISGLVSRRACPDAKVVSHGAGGEVLGSLPVISGRDSAIRIRQFSGRSAAYIMRSTGYLRAGPEWASDARYFKGPIR